MEPFDPDAAKRISAAFMDALVEAKLKIDAGCYDDDLRGLVQHAREMLDLLREQLAAADAPATDQLRATCNLMEVNLAWLVSAVVRPVPGPTTH